MKHPHSTGPPAKGYERFEALHVDGPEPGIRRILLGAVPDADAADVHRDLARIWTVFDDDASARVVLVHGVDGTFWRPSGLEAVAELARDFEARARVMNEARSLVAGLVTCRKPIVAAVEGTVTGAGLAVALLADIAVAGRSTTFVERHVELGVAAGDHAVLVWPLLCGMARAKYHLLTGEPLSGVEAERMGLVALAMPDADVVPRAFEVARRLAASSPTAVQWTRRALNGWFERALPAFEASLALEFLGFGGPEVAELLEART